MSVGLPSVPGTLPLLPLFVVYASAPAHLGITVVGTACRTAAVVLQAFGASQEGGAHPLFRQVVSSAVVCAVPVVVLYLIFERDLVGGLTGGLK
ncbi:MAG TPA: hypothetical protein VGN22_11960 [Pseudonocardia sp.]